MSTTEEIMSAAKNLSELIAEHPTTKKFEAAVNKLNDDTEAQRTLADQQRLIGKLAEKEAEGQPIEPEEKQQLEAVRQKVMMNPVLGELQMAQMDYLDLMRQVEQVMFGTAAPGGGGAGDGGPMLA